MVIYAIFFSLSFAPESFQSFVSMQKRAKKNRSKLNEGEREREIG